MLKFTHASLIGKQAGISSSHFIFFRKRSKHVSMPSFFSFKYILQIILAIRHIFLQQFSITEVPPNISLFRNLAY